MNRPTHTTTSFTKVSLKSRIVLPRGKRRVKPIDKASAETGDPFASFAEWSGEADKKAYAKL